MPHMQVAEEVQAMNLADHGSNKEPTTDADKPNRSAPPVVVVVFETCKRTAQQWHKQSASGSVSKDGANTRRAQALTHCPSSDHAMPLLAPLYRLRLLLGCSMSDFLMEPWCCKL
jgi:hypothetical protein